MRQLFVLPLMLVSIFVSRPVHAQIVGDLAHDISTNYWGAGIDPYPSPSSTYWPNFVCTASSLAGTSSYSTSLVCGDGYSTKEGDKHSQGAAFHDSCYGIPTGCEQLMSSQQYDKAYDTISWYIMHCYGEADPGRVLGSDLSSASGSTQLSTEAGRLQYRKWILDTVIDLRSDDGWFCFSVDALSASYNFEGTNIPAALAIKKFLIDNPRCQGYHDQFAFEYSNGRKNQIAVWQDTAKNNNMKNFDSTLPSFHMLGLDTLLNFASVHHYDAVGPQILLDAHITSNPFEAQTSVSLTTNREAYLHIDVLDLLGRKLQGAGYDGVFEPGSRTIPLKMSSLATGTYYVRISTANNELRTIEIVKQE